MKSLIAILMMSLGCGGAPFGYAPLLLNEADAPVAELDSGVEVALDAGGDAQVDAAPTQGQEAQVDQAADLDAAKEACTPIPSSITHRGYCPPGAAPGNALDVSNFAAVWSPTTLPDGAVYIGCGGVATPIRCRCQETYDCACIMAQVDVVSTCQTAASGASCTMATGAPTLICPGVK